MGQGLGDTSWGVTGFGGHLLGCDWVWGTPAGVGQGLGDTSWGVTGFVGHLLKWDRV